MCGICGIIDFKGTQTDLEGRLPRMISTLHHRGPDGCGTWTGDSVALGHARLSIIDLSTGSQPLTNEDGCVCLTYNGEIYNFQKLRQELQAKGHLFRTQTDTEVIVHLFEEEGIDLVNRLRGMFAFAIWDTRSRTIYLVRDRIGIKPLYYTVLNGRLIFGSEIKAILAHGAVPRAVREDALSDYLTYLYVPGPKTMFKNIFKLQAGHWLRFNAEGIQTRQYWDLPEVQASGGSDEPEIEQDIISHLAESTKMRLVSDVPLGAFLSGGVDSSSVVAMMSRAGQDPLITTSIGFEESRYNELPFARRVAQRYKTEHYEEVVRPDAVGIIEKLAWHFDEPFADYSSIPTYYVSKVARNHVTVALSGDGGDENFAGYRRYRLDSMERRIRGLLPCFIRKWMVSPLAKIYPKADWLPRPMRAKSTLANIAVDPATAYCQSVGFLNDQQKQPLLTADIRQLLKGYCSADIIRGYMTGTARQGLNQLMYADFKTWLVDDILTKVDRASMAVSLEVRVPLLDHEFVEFACRVPPDLKVRDRQGKAIFKSALRPYLDNDILYRTKQGFTPPIVQWLRGSLREMVGDLLLAPAPDYADYFDSSVVRRFWQEHQSGIRNYGPLLWAIFVFELWSRRFMHP